MSGGFKEVQRSWSSVREDLQGLSSSQEEADMRIVVHARDATLSGYKQVNVICRDTDVLVLLLAHKHNLCDEVWMFAGTSRKKHFIPVHRIEISEETRNSLQGLSRDHGVRHHKPVLWDKKGKCLESIR